MAKKTTPKKTVKKVATKKTATKKVTATKKATATKKTTTKKATATKKATTASLVQTRIIARVDVGFGNNLYIRGEGAGLSWDVGILMRNRSPYEWAWERKTADNPIEYKLLINDELWANGENQFAQSDETSITAPTFNWL